MTRCWFFGKLERSRMSDDGVSDASGNTGGTEARTRWLTAGEVSAAVGVRSSTARGHWHVEVTFHLAFCSRPRGPFPEIGHVLRQELSLGI